MSKKFKYTFSIVFIYVLIANYFFFINIDETTPVFNNEELKTTTENETDYYNYYVDFNGELNTKNFNKQMKKFKGLDYEIKKLYTTPKIQYDKLLISKLKEYSYDNLDNYVKYYIKNLKEYNLDEEINDVNVFGIKINKILISTSKSNIKTMKKINNKITYKQKED